MSFNLTEPPWTCAGGQYTTHVGSTWLMARCACMLMNIVHHETVIRSITETVSLHGVIAMVLSVAGSEPWGLYLPTGAAAVYPIAGKRVGG